MSTSQTLVAHGSAPYQHDPENASSYYATLQNANGRERTVWGVDIQRSLAEAGVEIGDKIDLSAGDRKLVTVKEKQPDGTIIEKSAERVEWITKKQPEAIKEAVPEVVNFPALAVVKDIADDQTPEQAKRADLADEYETETAPARDARNAVIEAHEKEYADKWSALQGDIEKARAAVGENFEINNVPQKHRDNILAMETAKLIERFEVSKYEAAMKLDKELPPAKKWVDFLEEKSINNDPAILNLLAEAKEAPEASMTGVSDGVPRPVVLADLTFKADKDGLSYLRGRDEIIKDRGHRLDVKRLDDRDIQAALQIASQKFDMDKGLVLSGDLAFRTRSAELAGRLGLKVQNMSPEMEKAWDRGQRSATILKQHERPNISNGISGEAKQPEMVVLKVDPRLGTPEKMQTTGLDVKFGEAANEVLMDPESYMGAMDAWRNSDFHTLEALAHADITVPDGGLDTSELAANAPEFVDGAALSRLAKEVVLVRDAKTLDARELASDKSVYLTSQDRVAMERERDDDLGMSSTLSSGGLITADAGDVNRWQDEGYSLAEIQAAGWETEKIQESTKELDDRERDAGPGF